MPKCQEPEILFGFTRHPAAAVWPDQTEDEFAQLCESIEAEGVLHPIIVTPHDEVIDGWHRARACAELNIEPPIDRRDPSGQEIAALINGVHGGRRHLKPIDLARLVTETRLVCGQSFAQSGDRGAENVITQAGVAQEAGVSKATAGRAIREMKREKGLLPEEEVDLEAAMPAFLRRDDPDADPPAPESAEATPEPPVGFGDPPENSIFSKYEAALVEIEDLREQIALRDARLTEDGTEAVAKAENDRKLIATLQKQVADWQRKHAEATRTVKNLRSQVSKLKKQVADATGETS